VRAIAYGYLWVHNTTAKLEKTSMTPVASETLATLYTDDETAWLEAMAEAAGRGDVSALDLDHLSEYLTDMALRDRREVKSRLVVLLTHLLKWEHQKERRTRGWRTTVLHQRNELSDLAGRGVLRAHAAAVLAEAYDRAVELAVSETALPQATFPSECRYTLEQLFVIELPEGEVGG
jgi:hypothetical protein